MKAIIHIGLPGSGKTTSIRRIFGDYNWIEDGVIHYIPNRVAVVSSDNYPGLYDKDKDFHPELLAKSHPACFREFIAAMLQGFPVVIVDNTNTSAIELAPYILGAQAHGYAVELREFVVSIETAERRNTHKVPRASLEAMAKRLAEPRPPWWPNPARFDMEGPIRDTGAGASFEQINP